MTTAIQDVSVTRFFGGVTAFNVVSREETDNALKVRKQWMQMMGFPEAEIDDECRRDPPTDLDEELRNYNAMFAIQSRNQKVQ